MGSSRGLKKPATFGGVALLLRFTVNFWKVLDWNFRRVGRVEFTLPPFLNERLRWIVEPSAKITGEYVLYWMHHAVRAHENPALDAAHCLAVQMGLPLLVYHGVSEDYPYASDRHHAFMMQGARDVEREFLDLGVRYAFHLQRDGARGPHLRELTRRASILVTEEMPVEPVVGWLERLRLACATPIATVDSSCIVPVSLLKKPFTRAFEFRDARKAYADARLSLPYPSLPSPADPFTGTLPFEPIDLQRADLRDLIGKCRIDHSVAPVIDTPGGSRAGYDRWGRFKATALREYSKRRNDAADQEGVSRMSAYLHYGMVSPFRIAREAAELNAEKFLDELLIWRELAFHFCFHNVEGLDSLDGVPDWAKRSLAVHARDIRRSDHSWESLARGQTESPLWNACQRSLLKHGELHNNVRMTWGKSFLHWTSSPDRALCMAIDLNHRFALDGRDPNSYGGLLWCFGQFDRPFEPEQPVFGVVRPRSPEEHTERISMPKFLGVIDRPTAARATRIAIIGAGIAGLVAARTLADHGLDVQVFEKSGGVGGRMATRRTVDGLQFDHGAQYFTARGEKFSRHVHSWIHDGLVRQWDGRIVELSDGTVMAEKQETARYVAVPGMNAIARSLATDLNITLDTTITDLRRIKGVENDRWHLIDHEQNRCGESDYVIVNCPPSQAEPLLRDHTPIAKTIESVEMLPCWASMVRLEAKISLPFDGAFVQNNPLAWISRNDSKPGRPRVEGSCWVLHGSASWSKANVDRDATAIEPLLHQAFRDAVEVPLGDIESFGTHRWRYAIPSTVLNELCLWDPTSKLGACGDWCGGPRIEGAYQSGVAMAGSLLRDLMIDRKPPERIATQPLLPF